MTYPLALYRVMCDGRLSVDAIQRLQTRRLRSVLCSAYDHVPHYGDIMRQIGYNPHHDYKGGADLRLLPVMTKSGLKQIDSSRLIDRRRQSKLPQFFCDHTSGTTGTPTTVYRSRRERALQIAKWLRVMFHNGYSPRDRVLSFTSPARLSPGRSLIQRTGLFRRLAIDYNLPPADSVELILRYRPQVIYGNRSSFDLVCDELSKRKIMIEGVKLVLAGGEVISERSRSLCKRTLAVDMTGMYGSVEMGIMAYQTRPDSPYRLSEDLTYFEFLDGDNNACLRGNQARIVVTDLTGTLMPFIRYDQGDIVVFDEKRSNDGLATRSLVAIQGRDDDFAVLPDGSRRTFKHFYEVIDVFDYIHGCRIVQKRLDLFDVRIVCDPVYFESIQQPLHEQLAATCPSGILFEVRRVATLPPDPGGKLRLLISEVV